MTSKQKVIMYVDDDADDRDLLVDAIQTANPDINVLQVRNGLEALDSLEKLVAANQPLPCLIVLDINMPYLDGKETAERLQEDKALRQVPLIIFTSSEKPQDREMFADMGITFFTKPFDLEYMSKIVNHMIGVCCV